MLFCVCYVIKGPSKWGSSACRSTQIFLIQTWKAKLLQFPAQGSAMSLASAGAPGLAHLSAVQGLLHLVRLICPLLKPAFVMVISRDRMRCWHDLQSAILFLKGSMPLKLLVNGDSLSLLSFWSKSWPSSADLLRSMFFYWVRQTYCHRMSETAVSGWPLALYVVFSMTHSQHISADHLVKLFSFPVKCIDQVSQWHTQFGMNSSASTKTSIHHSMLLPCTYASS